MKLGKLLLPLILLMFSVQVHADMYKESAALANRILKFAKEVGEIPVANCPSNHASPPSKGVRSGQLTSDANQSISVSVVSQTRVQELFRDMAGQAHIPFRYPDDGCYARAHEMSKLMEERHGIISAKAFIEGNLQVQTANHPSGSVSWWYHVAPVVLVQQGNKQVPYVIDPSIFNRAVPLKEWHNIQTRHTGGNIDRTYFTNRFGYTPSDRLNNLSSYNEDNNYTDTVTTMREYLQESRNRHGSN